MVGLMFAGNPFRQLNSSKFRAFVRFIDLIALELREEDVELNGVGLLWKIRVTA